MPKRTLWRYAVGDKTVNRVTVYERPDSPNLYVEWYDDDGRHQESLRTASGRPVTDRAKAMQIAERMAEEQEQRRNASAIELIFGSQGNHTLKELLDALHEARGDSWRPTTKKGQDRFRKFWLAKLGPGFRIKGWNAPLIERIIRRQGKKEKWSPRTRGSYLRYLIDASYYGQHKLKWITEEHNLSAVEIPDPESEGTAYTEAEIRRLLPALRAADPRAGLVGDAYWQAGRRITATRTLRVEHVRLDGDFAVLSYPMRSDKARKRGEAVLAGLAVGNLRQLLEAPAVQASGLLCPAGELSSPKARRDPVRLELFNRKWLVAAEKAARIPHIAGRGYHGIKRTFATEVEDLDAASAQSGTTRQTLVAIYRQPNLKPKKKLAQTLADAVDSERDPL